MDNYNDNKYNDLLYVNCYAKKYNICNNISKLKNGMCDKCYKEINRRLSQKELFYNYISIKKLIINEIRKLLNESESICGKINKGKKIFYIYDLLYHNIYFTLTSVKFIKTYVNKIIEIVKDEMEILNKIVDEQINKNIIYIDILDFMINVYEHYKNIKINDLSDEQFLFDYNNFMKNIYDVICKKYNNEQSLNTLCKEENNIYSDTFYNHLNPIQIVSH